MYALFAGLIYYPEGGWADHRLTTADLAVAQAAAKAAEGDADWWHIIHVPTGMVIERWSTNIYSASGPLADA